MVILASLVVAALLLLTLAPYLRPAELWLYDEWYTAERVHNIVHRGDWLTLYENGMPVFKKPPLQYWASALLILAGLPETLALRLPSFVSAFAVMAVVAHLAYRLSGKVLAVPLALTLLLSSSLFWITASAALLDMGAALLLLLTVVALFRAWDDPRWWWGVAIAAGLGALQKTPAAAIALPLGAAFLSLRGSRPVAPGRHAHAVWLGLALLLVWPLTESLIHDATTVQTVVLKEQIGRFLPALQDWHRHLRWTAWIANDSATLWMALITGSLFLPFYVASPQARASALLVLSFFIACTLAKGELFDRYLVQILPLAAAASAAMLATLPRHLGIFAALVATIAATGPYRSPARAGLTGEGIAPFRPILAEFRAALRPDEQPIVCGWEKSDLVLFPGALWLLGSGDKPFRRVWSVDDLLSALRIDNIKPPLRGICFDTEFEALAAKLPAHIVSTDAGMVHWTYP